MKIGLILTILYGRINLGLDYFCFLAGVIFSLIVIFILSISTSITLLSPYHVYKLHQPHLLHHCIAYSEKFATPH